LVGDQVAVQPAALMEPVSVSEIFRLHRKSLGVPDRTGDQPFLVLSQVHSCLSVVSRGWRVERFEAE
jgi:hypothetical protein